MRSAGLGELASHPLLPLPIKNIETKPPHPQSFESLIRQAFFHVDIIGPQVTDGFFDILSPKGHVILPSVWDDVIEPGWEISMHMWPMAPPPPEGDVVEVVEIVEEGGRGCRRERLRDILEEGRDSVCWVVG